VDCARRTQVNKGRVGATPREGTRISNLSNRGDLRNAGPRSSSFVSRLSSMTTQWDLLIVEAGSWSWVAAALNYPASATETNMLMSSRLVVLRMRNTVLQH
jgi:hypothetical protein